MPNQKPEELDEIYFVKTTKEVGSYCRPQPALPSSSLTEPKLVLLVQQGTCNLEELGDPLWRQVVTNLD